MQISYRVVSALDLSEKLCRDRIFGRLFPKGIDVALPEVNFCAISSTIPSTSRNGNNQHLCMMLANRRQVLPTVRVLREFLVERMKEVVAA
jgi:hypothetical protein